MATNKRKAESFGSPLFLGINRLGKETLLLKTILSCYFFAAFF